MSESEIKDPNDRELYEWLEATGVDALPFLKNQMIHCENMRRHCSDMNKLAMTQLGYWFTTSLVLMTVLFVLALEVGS